MARPGQQVVAGDRLADRIGVGVLAKVFPPELVDRVVEEAGVREQRARALPARVVVYYVLAMVLFFQSGYAEVWNKLVAGLDWARRFRARLALGMQPTPAAITLARQRLGWRVMEALLAEAAGPLACHEQQAAFVSGMRLVAADGMCLDLPDTAENAAEFGYPGNEHGPGPFPQIRVVGLGECGTRAVLGAALSPLASGEQALLRDLLARLRPGDLLLADRNFLSHGLLKQVLDAGLHVLWRAKSDMDLPVLEVLADGTYRSRITDPEASRKMRRKGARPGPATGSAGGSATRARFPPQELDEALSDLAFEITFFRNLVPARPGRRYARETKRSGGRYKTRRHGQSSLLTPLTVIKFWPLPVPP